MKKHRCWFSLLLVPLCLFVWSCSDDNSSKSETHGSKQEFGLVISEPEVVDAGNDQAYVYVDIMANGEKTTIMSDITTTDNVDTIAANLVPGCLIDYIPVSAHDSDIASVPENPQDTFNPILKSPAETVSFFGSDYPIHIFDTMKYGPELSPVGDTPGAMVAAGWVYAKSQSNANDWTITIGDGRVVSEDISGRALPEPVKRYEETYQVAKNVAVYNINTDDFSLSSISDFASVPVTTDYDYATTSRQTAYLVFDQNFRKAEQAKVVAIYYFIPQDQSDGKPVWDVPTQSTLLEGKGIDPVSGEEYSAIRANYPHVAPYSRSTEPFEIVKDTFYYIGDNEVAVYLLNADMGTPNDTSDDKLIMLDAGWPYSGYQYWKNIEAMGHDPRKVTDWLLTHGHGDHYGTALELTTMVENAGGDITLWGPKEDIIGITEDALGNTWDLAGALPEGETEIRTRSEYYTYDTWYDYGNVQIMVTPTPGHTTGTASFVFKVTDPETNGSVSFGYMGGYGFNGLYTPTASNGWKRLNFQLGLAWLAQNIEVDYVAPQHTNQYPIVEVYQALKAYNNDPANAGNQLTMLDALTSTMEDSPEGISTEFMNFCEKRYQVATGALSDISDSRYSSIETTGPFKPGRENGLEDVTVQLIDGGKIIQGFNPAQNKNPQIPLLADGITILKDTYVSDPEGWYVQFYMDVQDSYEGYLPEGHHQDAIEYEGIDGDGNIVTKQLDAIEYEGGPVESLHAAEGAPEVLRTQRLDSLEDAKKILASVEAGGTYTISLTKASAIVVPEDVESTFR